MKNINKFTFIVLLLFGAFNIFAQDRNVAWVHGLGGDAVSWQHYNAIFDAERKINSLRTSYNTSNGIDVAANQVKSSMDSFYGSNANNSQNIGIGHSMGGLMIRDVDRLTLTGGKKFGGLITVASPNYGAPIANSLLDSSVQNAAANACNKLTDGPVSQLFGLPWVILPNLATNVLCNKFISNNLIQNLWGSPVTNSDLAVGSPTINSINNYNTQIPRISIWAEENSPVHWRLIGSQESGNDEAFLSTISSARGVYNGFYVYNTSMAVAAALSGLLNPLSWGDAALYIYRATQWANGRDWIDDSENIWCSLIKTTRIEQQTYWLEVWVPCAYPPGDLTKSAAGQNDGNIASPYKSIDPNCGTWEWRQFTRSISVIYPSDGFLPQYTQELQSIVSGNKYKISGANHIEVRDMSNSTLNGVPNDDTKLKFNQIFDRQQGDFFRTAKRL